MVLTGTATLDNVIAGNVIGLRRNPSKQADRRRAKSGRRRLDHRRGAGHAHRRSHPEANVIAANSANGVHISGSGAMTTTIQGNLIGVTQDGVAFVYRGNGQNGVLVDGSARNVVIEGSTIFSNTLNGVLVADSAQQVKVSNTLFTRNGAKAIELDPETSGAPGVTTNPNHDIDPPFNLSLNQNGVLSGQVLVGSNNASCSSPCVIQIFTADPVLLDGQARTDRYANHPESAPATSAPTLGIVCHSR